MDNQQTNANQIAIIGMALRFPGADSPAQFWANLAAGQESITFFDDDDLLAEGLNPTLLQNPRYVKAQGILNNVEYFDAGFFGYSPREAEILDPQQRIFLECAWQAFEHAGLDPETFAGKIGVYAGAGISTYLLNNLMPNAGLRQSMGDFQLILANDKDFLPTRVSYKLNLKGPSVNVNTACSTSLVAVHLACQSLLNYECDLALAGGATIAARQKEGYLYSEGSIESPDGHCRAFDAAAGGTVGGSGAGIVILKRLAEAIADGDHIEAVIRGSAINNDGAGKVGFTAPSVDGQAEAIVLAQTLAEVDPETITYIEAHGTGTILGDPIEVAALSQAFGVGSHKTGYCALGSVKTNIGHLDAASGVAGLIKTVLALQHRQIPPSLHFETPNPKINFANGPFYVNKQLKTWPAGLTPRRAGVSSFGIGGTNAHVVVEEAPGMVKSGVSREWQLLLLSARSEEALEQAADQLQNFLQQNSTVSLPDLAYTLQVGRRAFEYRRMALVRSQAEAVAALQGETPRAVFTGNPVSQSPKVVFMFPGQGAQYINMARGIYQTEPVFRQLVDECAEFLIPFLGLDFRTVLFPDSQDEQQALEKLNQTILTQPLLFVIEYALARLWMDWGIQPAALIGHSVGEFVAATLAGVFSLQDGLRLIARRAQLMQSVAPGAMTAVSLPEQELNLLLGENLSLAAVNAPSSCVVSGPFSQIEVLEGLLMQRDVPFRRLHTSHAFHSAMIDEIIEQFEKVVQTVVFKPPQIPLVSNLSGLWLDGTQALDPGYWTRHMRNTVRFGDGLAALLKNNDYIFLEVGPGRTLSSLVRQVQPGTSRVVLTSTRHPQEERQDHEFLLESLGRLWLAGMPVKWENFYRSENRQRVVSPTYPFQRQRYWVEAPNQYQPFAASGTAPAVEENRSLILHSGPRLGSKFVAARTETEKILTGIWQNMLGIEQIGVYDNFFELGGHSLLATRLISQAREIFQIDIPLVTAFESPTIEGQARSIEQAKIDQLDVDLLEQMLAEIEGDQNNSSES